MGGAAYHKLASYATSGYLHAMYNFYVTSVWLSYFVPGVLVLALLYKAAEQVKAKWSFPRFEVPELNVMAIKVLLGACLFFLILRGAASWLSARQLRLDAAALSGEIISFADERQKQIPSTETHDWDAYTRGFAHVAATTRDDYVQRYGERVSLLRREFRRRGLADNTLDSFYASPKDPLTVRAVGEHLALLAAQL